MHRIVLLTSLAVCLILSPNFTSADDLSGAGKAVDGRTLVIAGKTVRLYGIDSPDRQQSCFTKHKKEFPCGKIAFTALATLIRNVELYCNYTEPTAENSEIQYVICRAGPMDVAKQHVLQGWAFADPETGDNYRRAERGARVLNEGLWKGKFELPWIWRKQHR